MRTEIEVVERLEGLAAIEQEWRELWERDQSATPFHSPEWLLPWTRHIWKGGRIRVLAMREGGRLTGLAPLFFWGYGASPEVIRCSLLGAGITDYLGILAAPGSGRACAMALFDWLWEARAGWHVCEFNDVAAGSPLLDVRPGAIELRDSPSNVCVVAPLAATIEEHLAGLESKFRTDLRRAESRLRARSPLRIVRADRELCGTLLDRLFALHRDRWNRRGEEGVLAASPLQAFHHEAAGRMLAAGMLRLYGLYAGEECIAVQYNLAARGTTYAYLSGFDPAWGKYSPGAILLKYAISDAILEGCRAIDFLRDQEFFKYQWGGVDHPLHRLQLLRSGIRAEEVA